MSKHTNDITPCPLCEEKLVQAHSDLAGIFRSVIKPRFQNCHISWSFRDQSNQNQAYAEGKSKLKWPMSAHNKMDDQGNPCSLALDLFELCSNGMAAWPWAFFRDIDSLIRAKNLPIIWGGDFKTIGDADHFQMNT